MQFCGVWVVKEQEVENFTSCSGNLFVIHIKNYCLFTQVTKVFINFPTSSLHPNVPFFTRACTLYLLEDVFYKLYYQGRYYLLAIMIIAQHCPKGQTHE